MSLRVRFALVLAGIATAILTLVSIASFVVLAEFLEQDAAAQLASLADDLHVEFDDGELELEGSLPPGAHYRILSRGRVIASDPEFPNVPLDVREGYSRFDNHQILVVSDEDDGYAFIVHLATDTSGVQAPLQAYVRAMSWILPFAVLLIGLASWWLAGRLTAPLAALEASARNVKGERELREPLPGTERNDEIGRLARTLQEAFARVAKTLDREQSFTRAAAHDLRSPLTAVRTRIQASLTRTRSAEQYQSTLQEIDQDVERLATLTDHLLLLAREEPHLHTTIVELGPVVADAVERTRSREPETDIDLQVRGTPSIEADPTLVTHVLQNLLDNAVKHGGGARVLVEVERRTADGAVVLRVHDEGPGVAPDVLGRLREPFFQADDARSHGGSGLGLAVVQRLVGLMNGELHLTSEPGEGFTAEVRWGKPRAQDSSEAPS